MYHLYILECEDQTLYTGITTDLDRRLTEHLTSPKSAKYTRGRRPVKLVYSRKMKNKKAALQEEYRIKRLPKKEKIKIIQENFPRKLKK